MKNIPDINIEKTQLEGKIKWVGMKRIQSAVSIKGSIIPTKVDCGVSLTKKDAKGIHMSRLYRIVNEIANEELSGSVLLSLLKKALDSHRELSDKVQIKIYFEYLTKRKSLKSDNNAYRSYPIIIDMSYNKQGVIETYIACDIYYSSACPCSEALSRQAVVDLFNEEFREEVISKEDVEKWLRDKEGVYAVPHSQRSIAHVNVKVENNFEISTIESLIDLVEDTLKTAVQATVKREDEQAFAVLNSQNLMFCEDALRRLNVSLGNRESYKDYRVEVTHKESLHPHNAVAFTEKWFN